jgi:hypothetical protein
MNRDKSKKGRAIDQGRQAGGELDPSYWLLLVEGHLTRQHFGSTLRRVAALPLSKA